MKLTRLISMLVIVALFASCAGQKVQTSEEDITIHLNQIGYFDGGYKSAIVIGGQDRFALIDAITKDVVFQGELGKSKYWEASGESVRIADFSAFQQEGTYRIKVGDTSSHPFTIGKKIFLEAGRASIKAFYFHRAGLALEEAFAGEYARPAGHPDTAIGIHASAATASRPEGSMISAPRGWYDAGDYNKYIVNSAITVSSMMSAIEHYPKLLLGLNTNIPESGGHFPDILDEIRWNLEWMLSMQDSEDGGVYHKLTAKNFGGMDLPHLDQDARWVVMKTTPAAYDFAASLAQAGRIYQPFDQEFAEKCTQAAMKAWEWAESMPNTPYVQPEDVQTGTYGQDRQVYDDERFWAASELMLTTGKNFEAPVPSPLLVPEWRDGAAFACMNRLNRDPLDAVREAFMVLADSLLQEQINSPYDVSNDAFRWGSTSDFLNQASVLAFAYKLTKDQPYLDAARSTYDWVFGKNPTGYSFLTGFGSKQALYIHHRPSEGDDVDMPQPGWVVGGPNPENKYDCGDSLYTSPYPAKAYLDLLCSYATNEIAINWNGAFVYTTFAILSLEENE